MMIVYWNFSVLNIFAYISDEITYLARLNATGLKAFFRRNSE